MNFKRNNVTKEYGQYDYSIAITRIVGCAMTFFVSLCADYRKFHNSTVQPVF